MENKDRTKKSHVISKLEERISELELEPSIAHIYKKKAKELYKFLDGISAPVQKSKEWYDIKKTTIGGSEIATVLGINPYRGLESLIAEKIGMGAGFTGNIATRWGNLFEHVTKKWGELILQMPEPIKEAGSIKGIIDRQRYSPDGLGIVKLLCTDGTYEYFTILFEFKAPLSTLPTKNIPKHYVPQIQTGLLNIPITDTSIFINNCYRKCLLSDLQFNSKYDTKFHSGDAKKLKHGMTNVDPFACGIICFYQTLEDYHKLYDYLGYGSDEDVDDANADTNEESITTSIPYVDLFKDLEQDINNTSTGINYYEDGDMELLLDTRDNPIDLGEVDSTVLGRVLELHEEKRLKVIYYPIIVNNNRVNEMKIVKTHGFERDDVNINPLKLGKIYLQRFLDKCDENGWATVGFLPWKLMRSEIIIEDRDEKWLEKIETPVKDALSKIDQILSSSDINKTFDTLFPSVDDNMHLDDDELNSMIIGTNNDKKETNNDKEVEDMVILED